MTEEVLKGRELAEGVHKLVRASCVRACCLQRAG